jgi:SAM-dependent methyltransferase
VSINVHRFAELKLEEISALQSRFTEYYSNPPDSYYEIADQAAAQYTPGLLPFHCDLVSRVENGAAVLELGCGTAHLCPFVEARGGTYTGLDFNRELLERNRQRFPRARFFKIGSDVRENFDIVASLYTIEHIVDPPAYLEMMWNFCKPGGLIAVICPDFIDGDGLPPSFYYGKTSRRLREKIISLAFADASQHLFDLFWLAPRWKKRARATEPGAFWINLQPRVLRGAEYSIDADAVHLSRLKDLVWWFEQRDGTVAATSRTLSDVDPAVLRHNCYVVAQKPIR